MTSTYMPISPAGVKAIRALSTTEQTAARSVALVRQLAIAATVLAAVVQIPVSDSANVFATMLILAGSIGTFLYVLRPRLIYLAPVSALSLLGFNAAALSAPLIIQSASLTPVTFDLQMPIATFLTLLLGQVILVAAHMAYLRTAPVQAARFTAQRLLQRIGAFERVSFAQLLVLGVIGLVATWVSSVTYENNIEFGDVTGKLIQALRFLAVAPVLGVLGVLYTGRVQDIHRRRIIVILAYFGVLMLVAFARNSRSFFSTVSVTLVLEFLLAALVGYVMLTRKRLLLFAVAIFCAMPVFGYLSDVATAMVMVRSERASTFGFDLIARTIEVASDREAVQRYRDIQASIQGYEVYNENYIANPFLSRLVLPRYHDNILVAAERLTDADRDRLLGWIGDKFIALLPTPLLRLFNIDIEKEDLAYSSADLFYNLYNGDDLGSYRVGSMVAEGFTILGIFFIPVLFLLAIVVFVSMDCFAIRLDRNRVAFSITILLSLWTVSNGVFPVDSSVTTASYLLRLLPQNLITCLVLLKATSLVLNVTAIRRF